MAVMLVAILLMLCRTASRSSDIALSCCGSKEGATSAIVSGTFCATGSACGANQPSCGYEFAIMARAAAPEDCHANGEAPPVQNVSRNREKAREARLRGDGCVLFLDWAFSG